MPRNLSFSMTKSQFIDGSKDVTRRDGWVFLRPGDILCAVEKSQGLKKGEKIVVLGMIRAKDVRREPLNRMTLDPKYGSEECRREGFPDMTPAEFVAFFCRGHKGCTPQKVVTRIEFEHLSTASATNGKESRSASGSGVTGAPPPDARSNPAVAGDNLEGRHG